MDRINREYLIRTIVGEAAGEPAEGQAAVAHAILNRMKAGRYGGSSVKDVVLAPNQFEPWSTRAQELFALTGEEPAYKRAAEIVDGVISGRIKDPTKGATHFLNKQIVQERSGKLPKWATGESLDIGRHSFLAPEGRVVAERKKVTDPALLEKLNTASTSRKKVTDPAILARLNGEGPDPARFGPRDTVTAGGKTDRLPESGTVTGFLRSVDDAVRGAADAATFGLSDEISASLSTGSLFGANEGLWGDYDEALAAERARDADGGWSRLGGQAVGALGAGVIAAPRVAANALGLGGRIAQGSALGAGSGAAYGFGSGEGVEDRAQGTAIGAATGAALGAGATAVTSAAGAGIRTLRDYISTRTNALANPAREAGRRVGSAIAIDRANTGGLTAADEASAALNRQDLINIDRGGETTRALARSAANNDPEARALLDRVASDRFGSQGQRARSFIDRITGGAADDLALQDSLREAARAANKPAYRKAYESPAAQAMWHDGFEQLMQAPAVQRAAQNATSRGANRAAAEGFTPVRNPFTMSDGRLVLRTNNDGTIARPTLAFWDQVKRNLDGDIGVAQRSGDNTLAGDLIALKNRLVSMLDESVPEYKAARSGAAAFFGAEDALEAGKKFVTQNRTLDETGRALKGMSKEERQAFAVGFASELKDAIKQSGDRTNVINKIFGSEQAREKVKLALGDKAFREFEQFVKVENVMDQLRGALGNSTTARQLAEMGLATTAGAGAGWMSGDWRTGLAVGLVTRGARAVGQKMDDRVTKEVARLLLSSDPKDVERLVTMANKTPKIEKVMKGVGDTLRKALIVRGAQEAEQAMSPRPLELTVSQPAAVH